MIFARRAGVEAEHRQILHVLRQHKGSSLEHENALGAVGAAEPEMFGEGCAERAAANNDEVERLQVAASWQTGSGTSVWINGDESFVVGVAYVTT